MHALRTVLLIGVAVALAPLSYAQDGGYTLDLCTTDTTCVGTRACFDTTSTESFTPCEEGAISVCVCAPPAPTFCSESSECDSGEVCAYTRTTPLSCISEQVVDSDPDIFEVGETIVPVAPPTGTPPPIWNNVGNVGRGGRCTRPLQCDSSKGLFCLSFGSGDPTRCTGADDNCRCAPRGVAKCNASVDCKDDEKCVVADDGSGGPVCVPDDIADDTEDVSEVTTSPEPKPSRRPRRTPKPSPDEPEVSEAPVPPTKTPKPVSSPTVTDEPTLTTEPADETAVPTTSAGVTIAPTPVVTPEPDFVSTPTPVSEATDVPSVSPLVIPTATVDPTATDDPSFTDDPSITDETTATDDGTTISEETDPSESPEDEICVSVEHLKDVPRARLVYKTDRPARVLCDRHLSCATPGHIVMHDGAAMMMSTYCARLEQGGEEACTNKVMLVNSVKYSRQGRIASRSEGLAFTHFAARFESKVEEAVMVAAVRLGL